MGSTQASADAKTNGWELAAETIAVKIRWFGLLVGFVLVNVQGHPVDRLALLNALLATLAVLSCAISRRRASLEEELLSSEDGFGLAYQRYTEGTGRFLPLLGRKAREGG